MGRLIFAPKPATPVPARLATPESSPFNDLYHVIRWSPQDGTVSPGAERSFDVTGTHLFVADCPGVAVHIKIGNKRNPWIRVRQGDTFSRPVVFRRVWLRLSDDTTFAGVQGQQQVILYVSTGELIQRPPVNFGHYLSTNFCTLTADGTFRTLLDLFGAAFLAGTIPARTPGKVGGRIILKVIDAANDLNIRGAGGPSSSYRLSRTDPPLVLDFNESAYLTAGSTAAQTVGFLVQSTAASTSFCVIFSTFEGDLTASFNPLLAGNVRLDLE